MNWVLAGVTFGFLGSAHCIGMCGPLALSLPGGDRMPWRFLIERLLYNSGRIVTYAGLGGIVGMLGHGAALAGAQQAVSIGMGTLMLLVAVVPWVRQQMQRFEQAPSTFIRRVMAPMNQLYERGGLGAMLGIGLLNGLLPCGFVYAALGTALTAGQILDSMAFMAAFGVGTGPVMLGVSLFGRLASTQWRSRLQQFVPVGLAVTGLLLIVRGLALGGMTSPLVPSLG